METNFPETVKRKTDKELEAIAKDDVFYPEKERLVALNELESRNGLTIELVQRKKDMESSLKNRLSDELLDKSVSRGTRFLNFLLDIIFINILAPIFWSILLVIYAIAYYIINPESFMEGHSFSFLDNKSPLFYAVLRDIIMSVSWMIYYSVFEGLTGRTPAKYITKTKVVNSKGEKPDFKTIFIRSLSRLFPFEQFSFFGSERTGWHDEWSKTTVVKI